MADLKVALKGKTAINYTIAPSNAINKDRAELILEGISGVADNLAINTALANLNTLRGEGTYPIRVDFLSGTINNIEQINIPDNFHLYGNGVTINQKNFQPEDVPNVIGSTVLSGINNIYIDGFNINPTLSINLASYGISISTGNIFNCTIGDCQTGINIDTGNIFNCTIGDCSSVAIGIDVTSTISNCILGDCFVGINGIDGNIINCKFGNCATGIYLTTGNISNCTVGNCVGGSGINLETGNVSNCTVGNCGSGINIDTGNIFNCTIGDCSSVAIYMISGENNIISGNRITGLTAASATGIGITGINCLVTDNNLAVKTDESSDYIVLLGTGTVKKNNMEGATWVA